MAGIRNPPRESGDMLVMTLTEEHLKLNNGFRLKPGHEAEKCIVSKLREKEREAIAHNGWAHLTMRDFQDGSLHQMDLSKHATNYYILDDWHVFVQARNNNKHSNYHLRPGTQVAFCCLAGLGIAGWLISVLVAIQHHTTQGGAKVEKRDVKLGMILLGINICITVTSVVVFTWWRSRVMMREMCVKAALIKQKEATEEAERKSMSKSVAVANASHEVRTALAGITGLLNSILDASRIEAGKMQVEEDEFDLQELLEDVVDLYYPVGMKKGVDVILDPCDESVEKFRRVRGDRGKLKQVLSNLLFNAIKFTDEGYVALRGFVATFCGVPAKTGGGEEEEEVNDSVLERKDGGIEYIFKVVDTGKGIPKEKRNSVFENYSQVKDMGRGKKHQLGHGLGLGIAQSLVRLMGGEIGIEDKETGERGTCFKFNIVLDNIVILESSSSHNNNINTYSSGHHVVVFMHCEERGKIIGRFLESRGIKVSLVQKGHQQLSRKLKKIKRGALNLPRSTTTPLPSYYSSSSSSKEELEDETMPLHTNTCMVLIIIDTSAAGEALFPEVIKAVSEFHRDLQPGCVRVLWIDTTALGRGVDNNFQLPSTDLIVSKPLQGSRLHSVLGLLPDFASSSQLGEIQVVIEKEKEEEDDENDGGSSSSEKKALTGKRILVVEDNPTLRKICTTVVSSLGALTYACTNGEEALQLVSSGLQDHHHQPPFDYILMDCEMPIMDGFEATKRIKEEGKAMGIWIPIIALTAHTGKEEMDKVTEAGMDYYLSKPINAATLLTAIHFLDKSTTHL
nr:histidine kinase CKI1-like [Ipomoea batatas]